MARQWALRISAAILAMAGLAILALLTAGIARSFAPAPAVQVKPAVAAVPVSKPASQPAADPIAEATTAPAVVTKPLLPTQSTQSSAFVVKRILQIDEPFVHGFYIWDDEGVPDGEIIITVDLKAESLSVFRGGYEIGAAVIKFGDALKPTPTGVFPITQKNADHISNIYDVPMPYMMRLTNDGIAIHGADVKWGYGTRGCIGVPTPFAKLLFEQVKLGDRVIVTNGKMLDLGDAIAS